MAGDGETAPRVRPLYRGVRETLVRRIAEGVWQPGQALPSEFEIAADLGVSQGTVRKALDELTAERLVVRRQGRGTYVARHDDERILFQFFKLIPDSGERRFPESRVLAVARRAADEAAAGRLGVAAGAGLVEIERVRCVGGTAAIVERITVADALYPGLAERALPNNLYELYAAEFGVTIAAATERLKAVAAGPREAEHLGLAPGTPLLAVDRTATAIDGRIAEWRVSLCRTDGLHYLCELP
ncbi:GntR family transcriptional regulator [Salinarimonas soli]|uniref:GntR family transcriptional regulator n=1 Tax=Salinarimonas soli TaxID=1638099 RepID=A0A5B2VFT2_9HYPH|nr:GntR family transcriptional regulator [Salinarimonas soli]KAA2237212.1 GntR family transcriptional regulator [Salinarimonas soli]